MRSIPAASFWDERDSACRSRAIPAHCCGPGTVLNRERIFAAIRGQAALAERHGERFAVVMVRMHGVREIGLRFGYERGEQAEQAARALIEQSLRPADRIFGAGEGGFVLVLPGMRNSNHVLLAATGLLRAFEQPVQSGSVPWHGRAIMGIALYPDHGTSADLLCRRAEMSHDEAQRSGQPYAVFAHDETQVDILYEELRATIESNRLEAWFQPVRDLQTGGIVGAESLARWYSPRLGDVPPASFVRFAEQSDLISPLTRWSINATLRHAAGLRDAQPMTYAINFSPRVFAEPGLVEQLMGALDVWNLPPTAVVAEITETALIHDFELSVRILQRMRDHGIRVAIDDFGTGYASFSYLRRFPATELKIDQSLVAGICGDARTAQLVRAMIDMAHHLDLVAVAEGIEDEATLALLTAMGCDLGQGFQLGRPQPAADFVARFTRPAGSP
jgi:diguanylate cyclase